LELPTVKKGKNLYYYDEKLQQLRNVVNPHDFQDLTADEAENLNYHIVFDDNKVLKVSNKARLYLTIRGINEKEFLNRLKTALTNMNCGKATLKANSSLSLDLSIRDNH
jgi:uncharacterized protein with ACT and thioredoxin-like domain